MGLRRRSREKTLQILYSMEFHSHLTYNEAVDSYYSYFDLPSQNATEEAIGEEKEFVYYLLEQSFTYREKIEQLIEKAAINWRMDRIAYIERNILRLSVAELIDDSNNIPFKASINEAIDIAKKFGSRESSSFINGIVNKIAELLDVKSKKL